VSENFSTLGLVGISLDKTGKLSVDGETLQGYLETNFEEVRSLFATGWTSTNASLTYYFHSYKTQAGTYNIQINGVNPVDGYFVDPGDASGSGEILTGISGNAQGLVVGYSGTATGQVGSMTLTLGLAELMDRALYQITDTTYGYLPTKKEIIQSTIEKYDRNIQTLEDRIDRKMQDMELRFIRMESTLSSLQSMSSWLTAQINSTG
jgi:flagellar capping protein FliD